MRARWSSRGCRLACALGFSSLAAVAQPATAQAILTTSGSPTAIKIITATVGSAPTSVTRTGTTYTTRTTSGNQKRITAQLSSNVPSGLTLTVTLTAVTGSVGVGAVTLNTTAKTVLDNITTTTSRTGAITYVLSATTAAGVIASTSRTVTFTLVTDP